MSQGSVLVTCPTYAGKEYALERWLAAFNALRYSDKAAYMVDNTGQGMGYFERLKREGIKCSHLQPFKNWDDTFRRCWELILAEALRGNHYWVYSVEADNIVAPESLSIMVELALYANIHLVTHGYPLHKSACKSSGVREDSFVYSEMGCMLMTTELLSRALAEYDTYGSIPLSIFRTCEKYVGGYCQLQNRFSVEHLDGFEMEYWQFDPLNDAKTFCPAPVAPADYGSVRPPSLLN